MNLFFKSYRVRLFFFLFITCGTCLNIGKAQSREIFPTPWIQEIELPEYYSDIPNCSFYLDSSGHIFLGKENGLTIITENRSEHLQFKGPVLVTGNGSDTAWYACPNDLGMIFRDTEGNLSIKSFKDRISRAYRDFRPLQLHCLGPALFMNTEAGVYKLEEGQIEVFPFRDAETKLHAPGNRLLLQVSGNGFLEWNGEGFSRTELKLPDQLIDNRVYSFIEILNRDEVLAVSSEKGIILLDSAGRTLSLLGKRSGIPDLDIRQAAKYDSDELWILGAHSLHKINHPSSLNILYMDPAYSGRIYGSVVNGNGIYLGTNHGLFYTWPDGNIEGPWKIMRVSDRGSFRLLEKTGDRVFGAGTGSLVAVEDGRSEIIASGSFTGFTAVTNDLVISSNEFGISRFIRGKQGWDSTLIDANLSGAHSFSSFEGQVFFLCNNSVFRISDEMDEAVKLPFHGDELLFALIPMESQLYLISNVQVYQYEKGEQTFLPLEEDHWARMLTLFDLIVPDEAGGFWRVSHNGKYRSRVSHTSGSSGFREDESYYPVLQDLGEIIDMNIRDSVLCLTGWDNISLFDLRMIDHHSGRIHIRIENRTGYSKSPDAKFYLTGLEFQSTPDPMFRYRLSPGNGTWSAWISDREVQLERLRPGNYRIEAQGMDLFGRISETGGLAFSVKAPIYRTWYAYVFYSIVFLILLFLIQKWRLLSYQRAETRVSQRMQSKFDILATEKEKSDKLVSEILPDRTAAQLKSEGKAKWDKYERATVLFSDIQGFTKIAEEMNPETLIDELDKFFFHFDSVVEKYNIEKIKTIGDAYMAAGGIPEKNSTNPVEVVLAALEMQAYMKQLKSTKTDIWDLRIGIHTGSVIAGVVGHKKVSYDIWGDTVNTASRMESSGEPGKVNISGITYGMVKEYFICEYRGKLPVKYKGNIDMYFVNGLRPELAIDLKGIPNKRFFTKLQLLRLGDLEEKIFGEVLKQLPDHLHFHTIEYAEKVYNQSFLLCRAEEVEQDERLLVRTAALMLFTGLTQTYTNYENRSAVISRELLPMFKYSETQIDHICNLILATKSPFHPNNRLEKILIDAKMEYIGRSDFLASIKLLFKEMKESGSALNGQQFKKQQIEILYEFEYFTVAARRLREIPGEEQMSNLEKERWI
jgi:adenylate cyclase